MRKKIVIIIIFLIGLVLIFLCVKMMNKNYMDTKKVRNSASEMFRMYREDSGNGQMITFTSVNKLQWFVTIYDDVNVFKWTDGSGSGIPVLPYIQVTSPEIKFGDKKVSVGMKKKEIQWIFRNSRRTTSYLEDSVYVLDEQRNISEQHIDAFYDEIFDHSLGFIYDEEDKVKYIYVGFGL